jgi:hypothetical protein
MDLTLALSVLKEGLTLWNSKESTKYLDRLIKLEMEYYEELNKPLDARSDYKLDSIMLEFTVLAQSFVMYPGKNRSTVGE